MNFHVTNLVLALAQCLILSLFTTEYLSRKYSGKLTAAACFFLWAGGYLLLYRIRLSGFLHYSIAALALFLFSFLSSLLLGKGNLGVHIKFGLLLWLSLMLSDITTVCIFVLGFGMQPEAPSFRFLTRVMGLLLIYVVCATLYILHCPMKKKNRFLLLFITDAFFLSQSFLLLLFFHSSWEVMSLKILQYGTVSSLVVVFISSLVFQVTKMVLQGEQIRKDIEFQTIEKHMQYDYYQLAQKNIEDLQKLRHDLNNQIQTALSLSCQESSKSRRQSKEMLQALQADLSRVLPLRYCQVPLINAILSIKAQQARDWGIPMEIHVSRLPDLPYENIDLCCVFANLLDNALEASRGLIPSQAVTVRVGIRADYFVLKVQNFSPEPPQRDPLGHYRSHKQSRDHGYGLPLVQETAQKYQGYLHTDYSSHTFTAAVFFKI